MITNISLHVRVYVNYPRARPRARDEDAWRGPGDGRRARVLCGADCGGGPVGLQLQGRRALLRAVITCDLGLRPPKHVHMHMHMRMRMIAKFSNMYKFKHPRVHSAQHCITSQQRPRLNTESSESAAKRGRCHCCLRRVRVLHEASNLFQAQYVTSKERQLAHTAKRHRLCRGWPRMRFGPGILHTRRWELKKKKLSHTQPVPTPYRPVAGPAPGRTREPNYKKKKVGSAGPPIEAAQPWVSATL